MVRVPPPEDAPAPEDELEQLGATADFTSIVIFLSERAPEPWATELYRIAQGVRRAA